MSGSTTRYGYSISLDAIDLLALDVGGFGRVGCHILFQRSHGKLLGRYTFITTLLSRMKYLFPTREGAYQADEATNATTSHHKVS
jgi:hypothetical protein